MFSKRATWDLQPNALSAALAARRQRGEPVVDLMESNPTRAGLSYPDDLWRALGQVEASVYRPQPLGLPSAREAVAGYYGERGPGVPAERILLTASTSEAYAYLIKLLADPGDQILVPRPSYPLFEYLGGLEGVQVGTYPLRYGPPCYGTRQSGVERWHIDADRLAAAVGPRTRAVIAVNPNNPTGSYVTAHERACLEDLALDCGFALIADEVFGDYPLAAATGSRPSFANDARALSFTLSGLSKVLGLPQLKLGWVAVAGPEGGVTEALSRLEVISDTYLSVATPVQEALPELLVHRPAIQAAIEARLQGNLRELRGKTADRDHVEVLECEGGWYAVLRVQADAERLAVELLKRDGVLVHPGSFYDFPPGEFVVVSLLSRNLTEGVDQLLTRLPR